LLKLPLVHVRAAAARGREQVVAARVVDHGLLDLAAHLQRDADAVDREAVDEVGGAVERIDDPDVVGTLPAVDLARFLGPDRVVGVGGQQRLDDSGLARMVHLGHEIVDLLLGDPDGFDVERGPVDDRAGSAGGLDGHVEHGMEIGGGHGLFELCGSARLARSSLIRS
jgi:hypothetical protein